MSEEWVIQLENLSCFSGKQAILSQINWQVKRGEKWVVFGHNGCGKTTLLSIIAGYKGFSSGQMHVFNQAYTAQNILSLRQRIGWVSSSFFDQYYTQEMVLDIVLAGVSKTLGVDCQAITARDYRRAQQQLSELGLKDKIYTPFHLLSKGERQKVLLARVFMRQPELLILDEPGTGLDVIAREHLLATIERLALDSEVTLIYVTHYPEEIIPVFTKCLFLRSGTIYKIGNTAQLFDSETLSAYWNHPISVTYSNGRPTLTIRPQSLNTLQEE